MLPPSLYDLPKMQYHATAVFTHTSVMSSYRGAGRPEAIALIERAMDMLAAELGMDPADLRRRDMRAGGVGMDPAGVRRRNLQRAAFPLTTITGLTYDSGDYERALDLALEAAGYEALRADQKARRERGDSVQLGIGVAAYVEMTAGLRPEGHA